jgi:hypothetical protein
MICFEHTRLAELWSIALDLCNGDVSEALAMLKDGLYGGADWAVYRAEMKRN